MVVAELIALVAVVFGGVALTRLVRAWIRSSSERRRVKDLRFDQMQQDLRDALASRDHRRMDDFMVTWVDHASKDVIQHVKRRRDELYVDSNT